MSRRPELLELLLSPLSATPNQFKVTVTQSPAGEGSAESDLPFVEAGQDWRSTLIRTLELVNFKPEYFTAAEQEWMVKAQLLAENAQVFHPHLRRTIGQVLYRALIPPHSKVERLLNESIQIARTRGQLLVQLKFEEDAVQVARLPDYPWELIHDGTGFLLHNQVGFSRYIAFPAVPPSLTSVEQVNVLLISSGASDKALGLKPLPKKERSAIAEALKTAIGAQRVQLVKLPEPTLDELGAYLTQHQGKDAPHLLHFDGHGLFGKRCSECRTMQKGIKAQQCKSCSTPLPDAQGYLLFEDEYGEPDYVSASQLGTLLQQTRQSDGSHQTGGVAALVLSACQSGMAVEGESVFQGTAQNLIYHGVPAVVAMQYSVSIEGAIAFAKQFYRSIGEKNSLAVAVSQGRAMMRVDENQWYRPVLYLRWRDNEGGQLFTPNATNLARVLDARTVEPYLRSLIANEKYQQKWGFYTSTDAIGKLQEQKQAATVLDIGLMVQLMQPKSAEADRNPKQQEKTERMPVLEGIRKYAAEHVLLMGRPGSGKTMALLRLLVDEARKALEDPSAKIPVLVELRYLDADRPSVLERMGAFLQSHGLPVEEATLKAALTEGKLLLLVDGVNELPSETARRAVARFRQDYPKTPMIFTTRDVALGGDVGIEKKLEMQPLSESQMRQFVQAYLPQQGEPMLRQLQGRLRGVGQTPLLLWMLCQVFQGLQQLPSSLGLLFRWFAGEYDKLKQDAPVSEGLRHWQAELLQHLAFTMMQAEEPTELRVSISRQEAERVLAAFLHGKVEYPEKRAKEWLEDLLEHYLIQRSSQNQLEFHHQLLQEYYAAEALRQRLPHLTNEQLKRDYLNYLKWTEPIALMLAMVEEEAQALRVVKLAMDDVDLMLGARLAGKVQEKFQEQTVALVCKPKLFNSMNLPEWLQAELLGKTKSEKAIPKLLEILKKIDFHQIALIEWGEDPDSQAIKKTCEALGQIGSDKCIEDLIKVLKDPDFEMRAEAASALAEIRSGKATKELILEFQEITTYIDELCEIEVICNSEHEKNISKNIENATCALDNITYALGCIGSEEPVPLLLQELQDPDSGIRASVAYALGRIGAKQAIPALIEALEDNYDGVRECVIDALSNIGEDSIPALIEALDWLDTNACESVVEVLEKIGTDSAISALHEVCKHPDVDISESAIKALENITNEFSQAQTILNKASHSGKSIGQFEALEDTSKLLRDLKNSDFTVRQETLRKLAKFSGPDALRKLWESRIQDDSSHLAIAINSIQSRYQFYNHEIAHGLIPQGQAIALFFSYASKDEALQNELAKHLNLLERQGVITSWDNRQILPGDEREQVISDRLNTADIILLLISADSIADYTCYDIEINRAMERHQAGEARVIPILLRPVDWTGAPFSQLPVLPKNHQPVTTWHDRDAVFEEIAEGIREVAIELRRAKQER